MQCPKCFKYDLKVLETRRLSRTIWRRRECKPCGERFWTQEAVTGDTPPSKLYLLSQAINAEKDKPRR